MVISAVSRAAARIANRNAWNQTRVARKARGKMSVRMRGEQGYKTQNYWKARAGPQKRLAQRRAYLKARSASQRRAYLKARIASVGPTRQNGRAIPTTAAKHRMYGRSGWAASTTNLRNQHMGTRKEIAARAVKIKALQKGSTKSQMKAKVDAMRRKLEKIQKAKGGKHLVIGKKIKIVKKTKKKKKGSKR
tara:strand:+ start:64 stop:636 length:573 start_codon:yes stop_codon:yes gene_type:complete